MRCPLFQTCGMCTRARCCRGVHLSQHTGWIETLQLSRIFSHLMHVCSKVVPKNILMIGPTGCGKTEIARQLLADTSYLTPV